MYLQVNRRQFKCGNCGDDRFTGITQEVIFGGQSDGSSGGKCRKGDAGGNRSVIASIGCCPTNTVVDG